MARLKVRLRGKTISEIPLSEDRQYTAGRKDDCDIHLQSEKGISREHFRLTSSGGAWTVETLSRFGEVLIGGEKAANVTLEHGMVFSVPPYEFEFLMTSADASHSEAPVAVPEIVEEGEESVDAAALPPTPNISPEAMEEKTFVGVAPSVPYIKIMDSQGEAKELIRLDGGDSYVAGRDSNCNIHIRDQRVSRRQFEIRKNGSQYSIIDLGSVNGTLLNGNPISNSDPTPLKSGDAISVLENYLYFELHDPNFKSRLEMVNLQPVEQMNPLVPLAESPVPATFGTMPPVPQGYYPPQANYPVPAGAAYPPAPWAPAPPVYEHAPPPPAGLMGKLKDKKNRPRVILGAVALLALVFAFSGGKEESKGPQAINPLYNDPLSKLTPEQKKLVKDTYQLAKSYYMQSKYAFARSELIKMQEIIPAYEDSDGLMKLVNEAIDVQQQQKKQEELERARAEQEEKIQLKTAECRKMINPNLTRDQMEQCLFEVMSFNPSHPLINELLAQADRMVADKAAREAQQAAHAASVEKLKGIYGRAKNVDKTDKPLDAIAAYERVIASDLPDPGRLKGAARSRITELKNQVDQKTAKYQADAKHFAEKGELKDAIISLRHARRVDPNNPYLQPQIDKYKGQLQEQMMVIYQEGILEESFGNIDGEGSDGDGGKQGAKKKWRQILERDVTDGEYYKKAYIKLKKYGAPQ